MPYRPGPGPRPGSCGAPGPSCRLPVGVNDTSVATSSAALSQPRRAGGSHAVIVARTDHLATLGVVEHLHDPPADARLAAHGHHPMGVAPEVDRTASHQRSISSVKASEAVAGSMATSTSDDTVVASVIGSVIAGSSRRDA